MQFKYRAKDPNGRDAFGVMEAENETQVYNRLKADGLIFVSAKKTIVKDKTRTMKIPVLSEFCLQLGTLLDSGVAMVRALAIIASEEKNTPYEKEVFSSLGDEVRKGNSLSDAMLTQGEAFPPLLTYMVKSAEAGGSLDLTCKRMAGHYKKMHMMHSKIKGALTYPKILGVMIVLVVTIILAFVVPQFGDVFSMAGSLPLPTKMLLGFSDFITKKWWVCIIVIISAILIYKLLMGRKQIKLAWDKRILRLPKIGILIRTIITANFARTLSSLYGAGLSIVFSLETARTTVDNTYVAGQFDKAIDIIRGGGNLSSAIASIDGFTGKLVSSILVGEETGQIDAMLESSADMLEHDSDEAISRLIAMIEPLMTVFMGVIVGFIMIAILMPIFGMYNQVGGSLG